MLGQSVAPKIRLEPYRKSYMTTMEQTTVTAWCAVDHVIMAETMAVMRSERDRPAMMIYRAVRDQARVNVYGQAEEDLRCS